jgi:hypothetical protein
MENEEKIKTIHYEKKLCVKDSIINSIPCLFSCAMWLGISIIGLDAIAYNFNQYPMWLPVALIIWLLIMFNTTKIINVPITTYTVKKGYYEDEE